MALGARALFWLLLPISALQGLKLRRVALRLPGAEGERRGVAGNGQPLRLLALGDSIIDGVGTGRVGRSLPVQFAHALAERSGCSVHWIVEGQSGFTIRDVLNHLDGMAVDPNPDVVLLSVGVNDVTGLSSTRRWRRRLLTLLDRIQMRWPGARVLFAGLPPMDRFPLPPQPLRFSLGLRAARLDLIAQKVIEGYPGAIHAPTRIDPRTHDFCADGFHPSAESCTLWARELAIIHSGSD